MLTFFKENIRWLGTGFLLTFTSAFGQTWFISLFALEIKSDFGLTDGTWGQIYTIATLAAAALMFVSGSLVDRFALSRLVPAIILLYAFAALGLNFASSVVSLGLCLFLLRYCGQGMCTHMSTTAMGRWFVATRGRALSVANLGHQAGQISLPIVAAIGIASIGWQASWLGVMAFLILVIVPLLGFLMMNNRTPRGNASKSSSPGLGGLHWTRSQAIRHWLLPSLVPVILTPGFITTVLFFHQTYIAESKSWSLLDMAPAYTFFAVTSVGAAILTGWASDRFGSDRLMPYILLPMGASLFLVGVGSEVWSWYAALALSGLTQGATSAFWGVFLPVAYGTRHLGAILSMSTTILVFSTAIGPGITGVLIDNGIDFSTQSIFMSVWCVLLSLVSIAISRRFRNGI